MNSSTFYTDLEKQKAQRLIIFTRHTSETNNCKITNMALKQNSQVTAENQVN